MQEGTPLSASTHCNCCGLRLPNTSVKPRPFCTQLVPGPLLQHPLLLVPNTPKQSENTVRHATSDEHPSGWPHDAERQTAHRTKGALLNAHNCCLSHPPRGARPAILFHKHSQTQTHQHSSSEPQHQHTTPALPVRLSTNMHPQHCLTMAGTPACHKPIPSSPPSLPLCLDHCLFTAAPHYQCQHNQHRQHHHQQAVAEVRLQGVKVCCRCDAGEKEVGAIAKQQAGGLQRCGG